MLRLRIWMYGRLFVILNQLDFIYFFIFVITCETKNIIDKYEKIILYADLDWVMRMFFR